MVASQVARSTGCDAGTFEKGLHTVLAFLQTLPETLAYQAPNCLGDRNPFSMSHIPDLLILLLFELDLSSYHCAIMTAWCHGVKKLDLTELASSESRRVPSPMILSGPFDSIRVG